MESCNTDKLQKIQSRSTDRHIQVKCNVCFRIMRSDHLKRHMWVHDKRRINECNQCEMTLPTERLLWNHMKSCNDISNHFTQTKENSNNREDIPSRGIVTISDEVK